MLGELVACYATAYRSLDGPRINFFIMENRIVVVLFCFLCVLKGGGFLSGWTESSPRSDLVCQRRVSQKVVLPNPLDLLVFFVPKEELRETCERALSEDDDGRWVSSKKSMVFTSRQPLNSASFKCQSILCWWWWWW